MGLRYRRRRISMERQQAIKRFRNQRRRNALAKPGSKEFIVVLDHLKPRFNVGKIFRSADAFGAKEVQLVGIDFFDPAPAMGSFKWVPARFFDQFRSCHDELIGRGYHIFRLDPCNGSLLSQATFPERSAFVFGHEEYGFSFDANDFPDIVPLSIPQFGRVQSLNVSVAASLTMYEYIRQRCR